MMDTHGDAIARGDVGRATHGTAAFGRGNGVSASKHGKRRHRIEPHGLASETRAQTFHATMHGCTKTNLERSDGPARGCNDRTWMPRSQSRFQLRKLGLSFCNHPTQGPFEAHFRFVELLLSFGDELRRRTNSRRQPIEVCPSRADVVLHRAVRTLEELLEHRETSCAIGHEHFGRLRGCRGSRIGDEIRECHIDLVPHGTHDRYGQTRDFPHEGFVIVRKEVFGGSPSPTEDDDFDFWHTREHVERSDHGLRRPGTLNRCTCKQNARRCAAERDRDDVVNRRSIATRDDTNHLRILRQGSLAFRGKQAFGRETLLESLERFEQRSTANRSNVCRDKLKLAPRDVHRGAPDEHDARTVGKHLSRSRRRCFVHDAVHARVFRFVLQLEVRMPARVQPHAGDFADDASVLGAAFDEAFQPMVELGDGDHRRLFGPSHDGALRLHAVASGPKCRDGFRISWPFVREIGA